jgi:hypothetical protein
MIKLNIILMCVYHVRVCVCVRVCVVNYPLRSRECGRIFWGILADGNLIPWLFMVRKKPTSVRY